MDVPSPTRDPFRLNIDHVPHGLLPPTASQRAWFRSRLNRDTRLYFRRLRQGVPVDDQSPLGDSGITAGELALHMIRSNHRRRQRRY